MILRGKHRIVLPLPRFNVVIKVAQVHVRGAARRIVEERGNPIAIVRQWRKFPVYIPGIRGLLVGGIVDNWREWWFWTSTHHPFLQPTWFSLLGLLNVQLYSQDHGTLPRDVLYEEFASIVGDDLIDDSHHFGNRRNFCRVGNGLRMHDYGDPRTQRIIRQHGDAFCRHRFFKETAPAEESP